MKKEGYHRLRKRAWVASSCVLLLLLLLLLIGWGLGFVGIFVETPVTHTHLKHIRADLAVLQGELNQTRICCDNATTQIGLLWTAVNTMTYNISTQPVVLMQEVTGVFNEWCGSETNDGALVKFTRTGDIVVVDVSPFICPACADGTGPITSIDSVVPPAFLPKANETTSAAIELSSWDGLPPKTLVRRLGAIIVMPDGVLNVWNTDMTSGNLTSFRQPLGEDCASWDAFSFVYRYGQDPYVYVP